MGRTGVNLGYQRDTAREKEKDLRARGFVSPCHVGIYMARLGRLERPAYGLEGRCSIQLSYRRVW